MGLFFIEEALILRPAPCNGGRNGRDKYTE